MVLSAMQFMPASQLGEIASTDYGVPVKGLRVAMRKRWADAQKGRDEAHPNEIEHGGPDAYIDHLKEDILKNGMQNPIRIKNGEIFDGHHRAIAAVELGLAKVPFKTFKPILR